MTRQDIKKNIFRSYGITVSLMSNSDDIDNIDNYIFKYEHVDLHDVDITFFTGNAACYPYIICKSRIKDNVINFIENLNIFLNKIGVEMRS